jgi:hypothetical protein
LAVGHNTRCQPSAVLGFGGGAKGFMVVDIGDGDRGFGDCRFRREILQEHM